MKKPLPNLAIPVLAMPREAKRIVAMSVDSGLCVLSVWLAYYLRLGEFITLSGNAVLAVGISIGIALPIFTISGLYRAIFRYSGWPALLAVARAVGIYGLLYASIFTAIGIQEVPRTVGIIQPILLLLFVGASRAFARLWLGDQYLGILKQAARPKVLIYGAGATGRQLVNAMANSHEMQVVGFLDDDDRLHGHVLNGQPIYNPIDLNRLVATLNISDVLLAMPRINRKRRNEIVTNMQTACIAVRTLPSVTDLVQGKVRITDLRDLEIDDLLGREPVKLDWQSICAGLGNRVVLVTGGGGSIGSELCRQIAQLEPKQLIILEHSEFNLFTIEQELRQQHPDLLLNCVLGDVCDRVDVSHVFKKFTPHIVFHAAAYKHVPMLENQVRTAVLNNVLGTQLVAIHAEQSSCEKFVLISTDKAVNPGNVMGATKRIAEMICQDMAIRSKTHFITVRFGNVLGSSGSVVPLFREQIGKGGPVTVTHPDMTRYFMTIPEACQLIMQASVIGAGEEIFVLDMGEPVRIVYLAEQMIRLSGKRIGDDIDIVFTGLRPGEKLFEELFHDAEQFKTTEHPKIMLAQSRNISHVQLDEAMQSLKSYCEQADDTRIRELIAKLVPEFKVFYPAATNIKLDRNIYPLKRIEPK